MMDLKILSNAIGCVATENFLQEQAFAQRDGIKKILADFIITQKTAHWLTLLQNRGLWAMEVLDWEKMMQHEAYKKLQMEQVITIGNEKVFTTRCPIRINGQKLYAGKPAPQLGGDNEKIKKDFLMG
jgi:crotonobetainyl-CoA:carnitine CoA-transferase CaiB-like acyl-CoA transferase